MHRAGAAALKRRVSCVCVRRARRQLLEDERVEFAGYIVRHPLLTSMEIRVQTKEDTYTPTDALVNAIQALNAQLDALHKDLKVCASRPAATAGSRCQTLRRSWTPHGLWMRKRTSGSGGGGRGGGGAAVGAVCFHSRNYSIVFAMQRSQLPQ